MHRHVEPVPHRREPQRSETVGPIAGSQTTVPVTMALAVTVRSGCLTRFAGRGRRGSTGCGAEDSSDDLSHYVQCTELRRAVGEASLSFGLGPLASKLIQSEVGKILGEERTERKGGKFDISKERCT